MSVATFNDTYPVALTVPPLTVAALPVKEISRLAVQLLTEVIGHPDAPPRSQMMAETLIVRESTAAPRGGAKRSLSRTKSVLARESAGASPATF